MRALSHGFLQWTPDYGQMWTAILLLACATFGCRSSSPSKAVAAGKTIDACVEWKPLVSEALRFDGSIFSSWDRGFLMKGAVGSCLPVPLDGITSEYSGEDVAGVVDQSGVLRWSRPLAYSLHVDLPPSRNRPPEGTRPWMLFVDKNTSQNNYRLSVNILNPLARIEQNGVATWTPPIPGNYSLTALGPAEGLFIARSGRRTPDFVARINQTGKVHALGQVSNQNEFFIHGTDAPDGGAFLLLSSHPKAFDGHRPNEPSVRVWLRRIDPTGRTLWNQPIGGLFRWSASTILAVNGRKQSYVMWQPDEFWSPSPICPNRIAPQECTHEPAGSWRLSRFTSDGEPLETIPVLRGDWTRVVEMAVDGEGTAYVVASRQDEIVGTEDSDPPPLRHHRLWLAILRTGGSPRAIELGTTTSQSARFHAAVFAGSKGRINVVVSRPIDRQGTVECPGSVEVACPPNSGYGRCTVDKVTLARVAPDCAGPLPALLVPSHGL